MKGAKRVHKHFRLDSAKLKRAQRVLRTRTETETVERALDLVIAEYNERLIPAAINNGKAPKRINRNSALHNTSK